MCERGVRGVCEEGVRGGCEVFEKLRGCERCV